MAEIRAEYARVSTALKTATLKLLDSKAARLAIPLMSTLFSEETTSIPVDLFHARVNALVADLDIAGLLDEKVVDGKLLARQWVVENWLYRDPGQEQESYELTGDAKSAMDYVARTTRKQVNVSASRIETMRRVIADAALAVNPDRQERMHRLTSEIQRLQEEHDRLAAGGALLEATDSELTEQYSNVLRELEGMPSDFRRLEEAVREMQRELIHRFREETNPIGEVIDDYLASARDLLVSTPEGRAFSGALELLRQHDLLESMNRDLETIISHSRSASLTAEEMRQLRGAVTVIRRGKDAVLTQRRRATATLTQQIKSYDHVANQALGEVLAGVQRELKTFMQTARPRHHVDLELLPLELELEHQRLTLYDPDSELVPEPLALPPTEVPTPPTLAELRARGGPSLSRLSEQVEQRLADGEKPSAGELFRSFDADLQRPVEILGLLRLLIRHDAEIHLEDLEEVTAVRPDGTRRRFQMPTVRLTTPDPTHSEREDA